MGLTESQLLFQVELPLALSVILSGVRVAVVIAVGLATIAAAIGAGGLGEFIFRGLAMVDNRVILAGAIPAAILALCWPIWCGMAGEAAASAMISGERMDCSGRSLRRICFLSCSPKHARSHCGGIQEFYRVVHPRRDHRTAD